MPCLGRFICSLAVAELGFKYLGINLAVMLGHPRRKPRLTALSNVKILVLPRDLCANLTAFMRVRTECANASMVVGFTIVSVVSLVLGLGSGCIGANGLAGNVTDMS